MTTEDDELQMLSACADELLSEYDTTAQPPGREPRALSPLERLATELEDLQ